MNDLDYLVNEDNNLVLERFRSLSELLDANNAEDHVHLLSRDHQVHEVFIVRQGLGHYLGPKFSKTSLE